VAQAFIQYSPWRVVTGQWRLIDIPRFGGLFLGILREFS